MNILRYTLLSDGSSDDALLPILSWLLSLHKVTCPLRPQWADLRRLSPPPKTFRLRIQRSLDLYPCDLLFVHRDAEREPYATRRREIQAALEEAARTSALPPAVCVIPVRMLEAWLLFDERALRRAAGNPNGKRPLELPPLSRLELLPDPKRNLYELLREASGQAGRRRARLSVRDCAKQVPRSIEDFFPLRGLPAFRELEAQIEETVSRQGWTGGEE